MVAARLVDDVEGANEQYQEHLCDTRMHLLYSNILAWWKEYNMYDDVKIF